MAKVLFKEEQKFRQKWLIVIIMIPMLISIWAIIQQVFLDRPFGNNPISDTGLILFLAVPLFVLGFFFSLTLHTKVNNQGIFYRFYPVHRKERMIPWDKVKQVSVRKYKPIREYGGWGFRKGRSGNALNTFGNMGLQIEFTDGRKLLLGTHKPVELKHVLGKIKPLSDS